MYCIDYMKETYFIFSLGLLYIQESPHDMEYKWFDQVDTGES